MHRGTSSRKRNSSLCVVSHRDTGQPAKYFSPHTNGDAVLHLSPQESPGTTLFNPPFGVMFGRGLSLLSFFLGVFTGLENKTMQIFRKLQKKGE